MHLCSFVHLWSRSSTEFRRKSNLSGPRYCNAHESRSERPIVGRLYTSARKWDSCSYSPGVHRPCRGRAAQAERRARSRRLVAELLRHQKRPLRLDSWWTSYRAPPEAAFAISAGRRLSPPPTPMREASELSHSKHLTHTVAWSQSERAAILLRSAPDCPTRSATRHLQRGWHRCCSRGARQWNRDPLLLQAPTSNSPIRVRVVRR
jgi:hypothetical protein